MEIVLLLPLNSWDWEESISQIRLGQASGWPCSTGGTLSSSRKKSVELVQALPEGEIKFRLKKTALWVGAVMKSEGRVSHGEVSLNISKPA